MHCGAGDVNSHSLDRSGARGPSDRAIRAYTRPGILLAGFERLELNAVADLGSVRFSPRLWITAVLKMPRENSLMQQSRRCPPDLL